MKVAIIGSKAPDSLESNLKESFDYNGHEAEVYDIYNDARYSNPKYGKYFTQLNILRRKYFDSYDQEVFIQLTRQIISDKPDLVIGVYRFIHPILVQTIKKELKCKIIHINPDALTTFEHQQVFASDYDVWFTKDPYIVNFMTNNMKLNAKLYSEAFNSRGHMKPNISKAQCEDDINIDVMTYGTMYPYRCRMLKYVLDSGIDLKVFGIKPNRFYNNSIDSAFQNKYITGTEKATILYGSKIVFNQMHYAEIESVNNRFFETNGSGAFQISDYRPILHDLLPQGVDVESVSFKGIDDAIEKLHYYLKHPEIRYNIASKVYAHFMEKYSYDSLIKYILNEI